jgi:monoterpene epsilon-lactone hydrolase
VEQSADILPFRQAPEGVEVRHLRAFVAVAEELNFSRAAERLYLSQPALSRQIRSLERLVGCELLRRSTHRVELTLAGDALLDRARKVLGELDEAVAAAQSVGGEMTGRMARLWAPVVETSSAGASIQDLRAEYERFMAQAPVPPDVEVRPVTAGGVPSLALGPDAQVLYLHGGGFIVGSAYGYRPLVGALVAAAGTGALVPDFRLAPEHPFPAAVEDTLSAYRWLVEQRGDAGKIVLAGDSAGGALIMSLLLTLSANGEDMPAGAVMLCPGIDLTGKMLAPVDQPHPFDDIGIVRENYLQGHPVEDPLVSSLRADLSGMPPMLIQVATGDRARPEGKALAERAQQHGVDARLELYPAETHVFHVFWPFLPEAADALAQAGSFIRERT